MKTVRVGLLVERQRAYGRSFCEGAAAYAQERSDISLGMLEWNDLYVGRKTEGYDAFVVRVLDDRMDKALRRTGKPVVDVFFGKDREGFAVVDLDNGAIARLAAEHFHERGFRSFAYCGYNGVRFSDNRRDAFVRYVAALGGDCSVFNSPKSAVGAFADDVVRSEVYAPPARERAMLVKWLRSLPSGTGVFCSHDLRAHQVLELCQSQGIEVPKDLAILGVDNDALLCGFTAPTLSSIDPDGFQTGRNAVMAAVQMIEKGPSVRTLPRSFTPPKMLFSRESTEIYPLDPAWLSDALVFIHRNYMRGIGPNDVFSHLGLSHTTVGRVFRSVRGTTVQNEILRVRMNDACRLLKTTGLSVKDIARRTGFASDQHFCHTFTSTMKTSPVEWRRQALAGAC